MYAPELAHYGVIGMKWGTHLSKEVRGAKKAYKEQRRKDREKYNDYLNKQIQKDEVDYKKYEAKGMSRQAFYKRRDGKYERAYVDYHKKRRDADNNYKNVITAARLKAYNRLYRKPFGKNELKHFGVLGMKWGKHKAKQPQGKPLGPVKIYGTASNGIQFFHDTPGIIVSSNVRLSKRHIDSINKQRAKGVSTMDALAKMGALGTVDRDYRQPLTSKQVRQAAERYAKANAKSGHVRRMGLTSAVIGIAAVKTALEAGAATDDPKTAAAVLVGSSAAASVLAYAGSRAIQSRRRKKNLESVRNNFGNVEGAYD